MVRVAEIRFYPFLLFVERALALVVPHVPGVFRLVRAAGRALTLPRVVKPLLVGPGVLGSVRHLVNSAGLGNRLNQQKNVNCLYKMTLENVLRSAKFEKHLKTLQLCSS